MSCNYNPERMKHLEKSIERWQRDQNKELSFAANMVGSELRRRRCDMSRLTLRQVKESLITLRLFRFYSSYVALFHLLKSGEKHSSQ